MRHSSEQYCSLLNRMQLRLENAEQVRDVVSQLASYAEDRVVAGVDYVYDTREAIRMGLWPYPYTYESWMSDWLEEKMNDPDIYFWWRLRGGTIGDLSEHKTWIYRTLDTWKRMAIHEALSIGLILYAPDLLYKKSKRPKTDMSLFRTPDSLVVDKKAIHNGRLTIDGEEWRVIPITRYAAGMSKGLYYDEERAPDICGTFYYYEPESTTYLAYKTEMRAFNKTEACRTLDVEETRDGFIPDSRVIRARMHSEGILPRDLMMTPSEAVAARGGKAVMLRGMSDDKHYAGNYLDLYALEDWLDQPLCNAASYAGYDVVILENMVGRYQVVTEVLDTRSREESFASLIYAVD